MKILVILGTRPEAIKLSPVILELKKRDIETFAINTGQHGDMVHSVLGWFGVTADVDLKLMTPDQPLCGLAWKLIERLPEWYRKYNPDVVIVQGDTTTAMMGALAAYYEGFPVAHVEAGLRTFNNLNPFPEEANRRMITAMAAWHFAPTKMAAENLLTEGIQYEGIHITGNTGIDALRISLGEKADEIPIIPLFENRRIILVTAHRRESFGEPLKRICEALKIIAQRRPDIEIVYPLHLNPNVYYAVWDMLNNIENICLIPPIRYPSMLGFLTECSFILTDSGGIQEEAAYLGKPCLVLRNETERREGLEAGIAKLVGTDITRIVDETEALIDDDSIDSEWPINIYGDGYAAEKIVDTFTQENPEWSQPFQRQLLSGMGKSTWRDVLIV